MALRALIPLLALLGFVSADGIYTKNSPVLQVTQKTYDSLIAQSNYTSVLEFYAPWCGHCQNLKPAYEKAAKNLAGLAKVAAINCDEESNKPLCGQMGVQGFPTLKIVKPGAKPGRPVVEDYQGARTAKAIVDAVVDKIPNHVKKVQDAGLEKFLSTSPTLPKAMLFTEKGTTSALIRALAVDFLGVVNFAQIRSKEAAAVERFGVQTFPSLVVLPGANKEPLLYDQEMKKPAILTFMSQVASPNPDPAPKQAKSKNAKNLKSASPSSTASSKFSQASAAHKTADLYEDLHPDQTIILGDNLPTDSPLPIVNQERPVPLPEVVLPAIPLLASADLVFTCLSAKSGTCVLVLLPRAGPDEPLAQYSTDTLAAMAELADKHAKRKASLFPFYGVPGEGNEASQKLRAELSLSENKVEILAVNVKRGWYKVHMAERNAAGLEGFIDSIRLGEAKQRLPEGFFATRSKGEQPSQAEPVQEPVASEAESETSVDAEEPKPAVHVEHNEL